MIIDGNTIETSQPSVTRDFVIVGAGTVGLFVAQHLAKKGHSVALIEVGERVASVRNDGFGATSIGMAHHGVNGGRAFGLGGTSTLWGGQLVEFAECDLQRPGHEWPLAYDELTRWYDLTYAALGLPPRGDEQGFCDKFGIPKYQDAGIEHFFTRWLPQPNFAALFREQLTRNANISIYLNVAAYGISFDQDQARLLKARTAAGGDLTFTARHFVLAAGAIGNAQFFLSTQRSDVPWRDNALVGKYFQDHLGGKAASLQVSNHKKFRAYFENGFAFGSKLQPKLRFSRGARDQQATGICGFFVYRSAVSSQISQLKALIRSFRSGLSFSKLSSLPRDVWRVGGSLAPFVWRYLKDHRVWAYYDQGVDFVFQAEQWPLEQSAICLGEGAPQCGLLPVTVNWQIDGREFAAIREFVERCRVFFESNGLAKVSVEEHVLQGNGAMTTALQDTFHQAGGLRMSRSPRSGVTDQDCRVWGTQNVHVAGTAVFPTSSYANCTLTALAMSLRLAHRLHALPAGNA